MAREGQFAMTSEMNTGEKATQLGSSARYPKIIRIVGFVALLHAGFGLLFVFSSMSVMLSKAPSTFEKVSLEKDIEELAKNLPDSVKEDVSLLLINGLSSPKFKLFYWMTGGLGVIFYAMLTCIGYQFIHVRLKFLWFFVGLMVFYFAYIFGLPKLFLSEPDTLSFALALVFNMGFGLMLLTWFWLWGPIIAVIGARELPQRPYKQIHSDDLRCRK